MIVNGASDGGRGIDMTNMKKWSAGIIFLLISLAFFYQSVFFQKLPVPSDTLVGLYHPWRDLYANEFPRGVPFKNFLITDPVRQQIPWKKVVIDSWKAGRVPTMNPYTFAGVPIDANVQAGPFYPLNILFLLFPFAYAWTGYIIIQPLLACLFFYVFARHLKATKVSSFVGSLAWGFGGFSIAWMTWGSILHTALWLPLILFSIDSILRVKDSRAPKRVWYAMLAGSLLMTIFAGHMQIAIYSVIVSVAYGIWRLMEFRHARVNRMLIRRLGLTLLIVFAVSSVQWVPFIRSIGESGRIDAYENWKLAGWYLPWEHLVQFWAPDFFGNPATLNYWGVWNYGEFIGYIGIIPLILALSAFSFSGASGFFTLVAAISVVFMLPNLLSMLPFRLGIPIVSVLQPTRLMMLVNFSLAVLTVFGMDMLWVRKTGRLSKSILMNSIIFFVLWMLIFSSRYIIHDAEFLAHLEIAKRNLVIPSALFVFFLVWTFVVRIFHKGVLREVLYLGLIGVVLFDLFRFGWKFTPFTPKEYFFPETQVIRFLERQEKPFRVMSLDDRLIPPNAGAYYGIETPEGYDPIAPKLYEDFLVSSERGKADLSRPTGFHRIFTAHNIDSPLLPYFNVRYVLSLTDVERPFLKEVMKEGETRVYEYTKGLPRVYFPAYSRRVNDESGTLTELFSHATQASAIYTQNIDIINFPVGADETAHITSYAAGRISVKTKSMNKRLLVILNRFDPRWSARLENGDQLDVLPVNYLFMGVVVPAGSHDIILSYR